MITYSTVPAVLSGLYTLLSEWPALASDSELVIRPGPVVSGDSNRKAIVVGWNGDPEDFTSVEFDVTPEGLGADTAREQYLVRLVAEVLADDGQMATAVSQVYALQTELALALASIRPANGGDNSLGGAKLLRVMLGGGTLATDLGQLKATLATGLVVDAFTASDSG